MLEWILIIAVLAAIFYAKDLPALRNKAIEVGNQLLEKAKEKKEQLAEKQKENKEENKDKK